MKTYGVAGDVVSFLPRPLYLLRKIPIAKKNKPKYILIPCGYQIVVVHSTAKMKKEGKVPFLLFIISLFIYSLIFI
jgi:hypothetical protein